MAVEWGEYSTIGVICTIILQLILIIERCLKRVKSSSCRKIKPDGTTVEMKIESNDRS